jgi:hypothetical protein
MGDLKLDLDSEAVMAFEEDDGLDDPDDPPDDDPA